MSPPPAVSSPPGRSPRLAALRTLGALLRGLARHSRGERWPVAVIALGLLLESAFGLFVPVAAGKLIDHTIPTHDTRSLAVILVVLGSGALAVAMVGVARDRLYARVLSGIFREMRVAMFGHLQRLSLDWFNRQHAADVAVLFSGDVATVENTMMGAPTWVLGPACDVAIATAVLFWLDWRLALVAMLVWPACLLGPVAFGMRARAVGDARYAVEGDTLAMVHESVASQATIRIFLLAGQMLRRFSDHAERLARASMRLTLANAIVERSSGIGIAFLRVLVLGIGAALAFRGSITLGTLAACQAVFLTLSGGLSWVTQYVPSLLGAAGCVLRIEALLGTVPKAPDAAERAGEELPRLAREIAVRDVWYDHDHEHPALAGLSLAIPRGASVAIVGPSGSGKSTLLGLMLRLNDPARGTITIDERDLRAGSVASLRAQAGLVAQDSVLFRATIRENIRLGRAGATDAEVEAAARAAEIHDFVTSLPAGYETMLGEGGLRLSGGQRQRVALARVIVRDAGILLLDEATSALDAATEAAVNATVRRLAAGRTVVSVTHRLATVTGADRIFVLDHGQVVESGTHHQLLMGRGLYRSLWEKQHGFLAADEPGRVEITPSRLRRVPLLARLDDATLAELAALFVAERAPADTVLVYEGDVADKFYILVRGRVEVTRSPAEGGEPARVAVLDDGDFFGEIGLLQDVPRTATVRTLTDCTCVVLGREQFRAVTARLPQLRQELLHSADRRTTPALSFAAIPATPSAAPRERRPVEPVE